MQKTRNSNVEINVSAPQDRRASDNYITINEGDPAHSTDAKKQENNYDFKNLAIDNHIRGFNNIQNINSQYYLTNYSTKKKETEIKNETE